MGTLRKLGLGPGVCVCVWTYRRNPLETVNQLWAAAVENLFKTCTLTYTRSPCYRDNMFLHLQWLPLTTLLAWPPFGSCWSWNAASLTLSVCSSIFFWLSCFYHGSCRLGVKGQDLVTDAACAEHATKTEATSVCLKRHTKTRHHQKESCVGTLSPL